MEAKCQQVKISDFLLYHGARERNWTVLTVDHQNLSTLMCSLNIFGINFKCFQETEENIQGRFVCMTSQ